MKTKFKLPICCASACVVLGATVVFGSKPYAKHYIESHYPGVTVQHISWHPALELSHVDLAITIEKPNLHAVLPHVTVYRDKFVWVQGGTVSLSLDEAKNENEGIHTKYMAENLDVKLTVKGHQVTLTGVSRQTDGVITAKAGSVSHEKADVVFAGLEKRPNGWLGFGHMQIVPKDLPFKNEVSLEQVMLKREPLEVISSKISVAPYGYAENVKITGTGVEHIHAETSHAWLNHAWLNPGPVEFDYPISIDVSNNDKIRLTLNETNSISWSRTSKHIEGGGSCNGWVKTFPKGLREPLETIALTGDISFVVDYGGKPQFKVKGGCKATCSGPAIQALRKPFHYSVYSSKNELVDRVSGPGSKEWVPITALPPTLPTAAMTMEDPGFLVHHGFIPQAFENSLIDNLKLDRFHRGGSTITMQLAKNLFLRRDKTLGRKGQEFFLAQELESCFTKEEILELYLNIVEFAPDVYGIGPAAQHYFKMSPILLNPVQSFYLASILPMPRRALPPTEATLAGIKKLMSHFATDGKIPENFLDGAMPQDDSEWGN